MSVVDIERHNFKAHLLEGVLYLSTSPLLSPQTTFPALIRRLGGNDLAIGAIPVVVYLINFIPQLFSANFVGQFPFHKSFVLRLGLIQRLHILLLGLLVGLLGISMPSVALAFVFIIYSSNQLTAGMVSPAWSEFIVKTVNPFHRGKLFGFRISLGALVGILLGFVLTVFLSYFNFPINFSCIFILAFLFQTSSLVAQRTVIEKSESRVTNPVPLAYLMVRIRKVLQENSLYRKFLYSSIFLIMSFMAVAFFTVSAIQKYSLNESYVGLFTIINFLGQIVSAALLGWLADKKGNRISLIVCWGSLMVAIIIALCAQNVSYYYVVLFLMGANVGSEYMLRFNFVLKCAPENERALYVGLMNACLAPFYLTSMIAGWISEMYGYTVVFYLSLVLGCFGLYLLWKIKGHNTGELALSSK